MEAAERRETLRRYFEAALDAGREGRGAVLAEARSVDGDLARELAELLEADDAVGDRFEKLDEVAVAMLVAEAGSDPILDAGQVGRFEVLGRIGSGGMGITYLARDPELQRRVALKVLTARQSEGAVDQLLHEARATSALDHPAVATVFDVGRTEDGRPFMAMAYYDGQTLADRLSERPVPTDEAVDIAIQMAEALQAAHEAGIVHRDVKPSNVMLVAGGVRVLDFGIASRTDGPGGAGEPTMGTIRYMSPERLGGSEGDGRADVWAVGVVLYEMLTGQRPFDGPDDAGVVARIEAGHPGPDWDALAACAPGAVTAVVRRCLEPDPEQRFSDGGALLAALLEARERMVKAPRRRVAAVAAVAVAVVAGLAVYSSRPAVDPAASVLAILPVVPASPDTALGRIGRDLAVTVAMNLDQVGEIEVIDPMTVAALQPVRDGSTPVQDRVRAAMELGATGVVAGILVPLGDRVRVDFQLVGDPAGEPVARGAVTSPSGALVDLTDSLSWEVLRSVWRVREPPSPSFLGITTSSFAALRAFLDGEQAVAEGRFRDAPGHFGRAVAADSTFWLAYWRLWWTSSWYGASVDAVVRRAVADHLDALPPRDSALALARLLPSHMDRYTTLRSTAEARPSDWFAWFNLQDHLIHDGGYLGRDLTESREASERVVRLEPSLVRGWDHLAWVTMAQRDTVRLNQVLARLEALDYDSLTLVENGFDDLEYLEVQRRIVVNGGLMGADDLALAVNLMSGIHGAALQLRVVGNLFSEGFSEAQLQLSDTLLALPVDVSLRGAALHARSVALAARGRWTEALDAAEAWEALHEGGASTLHALRLAAVGSVLGGIDPGRIDNHASRMDPEELAADPGLEAEVSWLLGLGAFSRRDRAALERARLRLDRVSADGAAHLSASLGALGLAVDGDAAQAARALDSLAWRGADAVLYRRLPEHPFHHGVIRLLAARWMIADGEALDAIRLLSWHEAVLPDGALWMVIRANRILQPLAWAARARAEAMLGREERAVRYYGRAGEHLDAPAPALAALMTEIGAEIR